MDMIGEEVENENIAYFEKTRRWSKTWWVVLGKNILGLLWSAILHILMWLGFGILAITHALIWTLEKIQKYVSKYTRIIKEDKLNYV